MGGLGHSKIALKIEPFDRAHKVPSSVPYRNYVRILHRFKDIPRYWSKIADFDLAHLYLAPPFLGANPSEFRRDLRRRKLESLGYRMALFA